jgi:hypothetical protein
MENKHYLLAFYKEIINLFDINKLKSRDGTSMLSIDELDSYFRVLINKYLDIVYDIDKAIERGELPPDILGEKYV